MPPESELEIILHPARANPGVQRKTAIFNLVSRITERAETMPKEDPSLVTIIKPPDKSALEDAHKILTLGSKRRVGAETVSFIDGPVYSLLDFAIRLFVRAPRSK